jgi:hypothetical protein
MYLHSFRACTSTNKVRCFLRHCFVWYTKRVRGGTAETDVGKSVPPDYVVLRRAKSTIGKAAKNSSVALFAACRSFLK